MKVTGKDYSLFLIRAGRDGGGALQIQSGVKNEVIEGMVHTMPGGFTLEFSVILKCLTRGQNLLAFPGFL